MMTRRIHRQRLGVLVERQVERAVTVPSSWETGVTSLDDADPDAADPDLVARHQRVGVGTSAEIL